MADDRSPADPQDAENRRAASSFQARLDEIQRALEETVDLRKIKGLHDQLAGFLSFLRTSHLGRGVVFRAAELKLRIERKGGKILPTLHLRGGDRRSASATNRPRLRHFGISRHESERWQLEATLLEEEFDAYIRRAGREGTVPSSNGLGRTAEIDSEKTRPADATAGPLDEIAAALRRLCQAGKSFGAIYVDPPWTPAGGRRGGSFHLDAQVARLPLAGLAAPGSHLYLKLIPDFREEGLKLLRIWGFTWKARLFGADARLGLQDSFGTVRDMWILGVRDGAGKAIHRLPPWIEEAGTLVIGCGEAVYHGIEEISPPPYLDVFGSRPFSNRWTIAAARWY